MSDYRLSARALFIAAMHLIFLAACQNSAAVPVAAVPTLAAPAVTVPTDTPVALPTFALPTATRTATPVPPLVTPSAPPVLPSATPLPPTATATATLAPTWPLVKTIGLSLAGRPLTSYQFNDGPEAIIFVGGMHGGYEWNTILLAYALIDYFTESPEVIPNGLTVYVIPAANPDGQFLVTFSNGRFSPAQVAEETVPGRFNANQVDLNRNWDCDWVPEALWQEKLVSGGSSPFSEPESQVLRDFFLQKRPSLVVFWHSAANGVFASGCQEPHPGSIALGQIYADAASYPFFTSFFAYDITGDAGDWLTLQGIASFTVELKNHQELDYEQNLAGVTALLQAYAAGE